MTGPRIKRVLFGGIDNGVFRIDGHEVGEWIRLLKECVVYVDSTVKSSHLVELMTEDGDTATGSPANVQGVTLRNVRNGSFRIMRGDVWGCDTTSVTTLSTSMALIRSQCAETGITWRATAAATAMDLLRKSAYIGPATPPRYRLVSYSAIHAGPMLHASGGSPMAAHIDRKAAYLHAMMQPVPVGLPYLIKNAKAAEHISAPALVYATVNVLHTDVTNQLPPLPIATKVGRLMYPVGRFRGCWPSHMLREAVDRGECEIETVHYSVRWQGFAPVLRTFAESMAALPKAVSKPMYTRIWGKLAAQGGWTGRREETPLSVPSGGLWWSSNAKPQWSESVPPFHRPDMAAWIVGTNHAEMLRAVRATRPETLIAAHVDAIWSSDVDACVSLAENDGAAGSWKLEEMGDVRYYGVGQYRILYGGDRYKLGICGWKDEHEPTPDEFDTWAANGSDEWRARGWIGNPRKEQSARSVAPVIMRDDYESVGGLDPTDARMWAAKGRVRGDYLRFLEHNPQPETGDMDL